MSIKRILAVSRQELYISRRSLEVIMDLLIFGTLNIIAFGYVSSYLTSSHHGVQSAYLLLGMLLWEVIRVSQYSISVGTMWNIWSHNLSNMFVAPLSIGEYVFAHLLSAAVKAFGLFILMNLLAFVFFGFNILSLGIINILLFFMNLNFFAWSSGLVLLGFIFRYGTRIQAIAWGAIFIFQPLAAAFIPVSYLPPPLRAIAWLLPPTYVFEAARAALNDPIVNWQYAATALAENVIFFGLAIWVFLALFRKSRETGQFARNDL